MEAPDAVTLRSFSLTRPSTVRLPATVTVALGSTAVNACKPSLRDASDNSIWMGTSLMVKVVSVLGELKLI